MGCEVSFMYYVCITFLKCIYLANLFVLINCRTAERHGTARVSTAYEFYTAVKCNLKHKAKCYANKAKPPFEATSYELYYYAANEADEIGKTDVMVTLDRSEMWDSTPLLGSSTCYEFVGMPPLPDGEHRIGMRLLPCPCEGCLRDDYDACSNRNLVSTMSVSVMRYKRRPEAPDRLVLPLQQYKVDVLKAFVKLHDLKLPHQCSKKDDIITFITNSLAMHIDNNDLPNE